MNEQNLTPLDEEKMSNVQSRWRSKYLWTAFIAQLIVIFRMTGLLEKIGIPENTLTDVATGILQLLVLLGILNNPTDSVNW